MPELESTLEGFWLTRVRLVGGYTIKLAPTERGIPDRLLVMPDGRMYLVELKREGGCLSAIQRAWHAKLATKNVHVHTLYGRDQVVKFLRAAVSISDPVSRPGPPLKEA